MSYHTSISFFIFVPVYALNRNILCFQDCIFICNYKYLGSRRMKINESFSYVLVQCVFVQAVSDENFLEICGYLTMIADIFKRCSLIATSSSSSFFQTVIEISISNDVNSNASSCYF